MMRDSLSKWLTISFLLIFFKIKTFVKKKIQTTFFLLQKNIKNIPIYITQNYYYYKLKHQTNSD